MKILFLIVYFTFQEPTEKYHIQTILQFYKDSINSYRKIKHGGGH